VLKNITRVAKQKSKDLSPRRKGLWRFGAKNVSMRSATNKYAV